MNCSRPRGWSFPGLDGLCLVAWACSLAGYAAAEPPPAAPNVEAAPELWPAVSPQEAGLQPERLEALWRALQEHDTQALLLIRRDHVVLERYAAGFTRHTPHYSASLAKALVGGLSLMLAMDQSRISPDDPVSRFVPGWAQEPQRSRITIRHLATHTSGIEDAEADGLPHDKLPGWKGEFWKRLDPLRDPFTLGRDITPVLDPPGTRARYSNPAIAVLGYCVTASLRGSATPDVRALLRKRLFEPLGIPVKEAGVGYGVETKLDDMDIVGAWGGAAFSPDATARLGEFVLHKGKWNGRQLLPGTHRRSGYTPRRFTQ